MEKESNLFGCFVSAALNSATREIENEKIVKEKIAKFNAYIYGEESLSSKINALKNVKFGTDVGFILVKFYVNPMQIQLENIKEIGNYRKKEKSFDVSIFINVDDFISMSHADRLTFLRNAIIQRLRQLQSVIEKKKFDTKMDLVIEDIEKALA